MKKVIYTMAFVACLGLTSKAQSADTPAPQAGQVNPDGTLKQEPVASPPKEKTKKSEEKPATRMAITEKGVPKTKSKATTPAPATKSQADPDQGKATKSETKPASAEKK